MIVVIYQMDVLAEKHKEFIQAAPLLLEKLPRQKGCLSHHFCQDLENKDRYFVIQKWVDQPELDTSWCSDRFGAFLGTFHLLKSEPVVEIHAVSFTAGMEAIKAARAKTASAAHNRGSPIASETI